MEQTKIIFTGGSGLLGSEFKKILPDILYPTHEQFDVTNSAGMKAYLQAHSCSLIIHAAAFTSPPLVDREPVKALETNIIGTANLVNLCQEHRIKLIYISTDYVFKGDQGLYSEEDDLYPVNKYAWSKLGGECAVRLYDNSIIVRTSFGPTPFPYEKAFVDQWTSRESAEMIARKISGLIHSDYIGAVHVGGDRRTVFDYAKSLDPTREIKELSTNEVSFSVPRDTSLNCEKYKAIAKPI